MSKKCDRCKIRFTLREHHQICLDCYTKKELLEPNENKIIDDFISYTRLHSSGKKRMHSFPYELFKNIERIGDGGFSTVYKAFFDNDHIYSHYFDRDNKRKSKYDKRNYGRQVVLKKLKNSKDLTSEKLNELKIYYQLSWKEKKKYHPISGRPTNISNYLGITQDPETKDFVIVMDYYDLGDLKSYISKDFYNVSWIDKLYILEDTICGLINFHNLNIIHKDIHNGNILLKNVNSSKEAVLCDFGISKSALEADDETVYGKTPYVAPEILNGQKYTTASDIYSLGMIMWELMTGRSPFWDHDHDEILTFKIIDGARPPIITNAPRGYIELMGECWHPNPEKRPTANELYKKIKNIKIEEWNNETQIIKSPDIGPTNTEIIESSSRCFSVNTTNDSLNLEFDKRKFSKIDDNFDESGKGNKKIKLTSENEDDGYVSEELYFDI
ncbi:hypothetical protein RclHR1_09760001 [Rhizophagus clarus]|uniref:Kinase-like domain-containing protein n=1 Tax=Rhizophagus clarus TaxID=94130 RepID=A0A2Z6S7G7_9GLOM|nr:hypothetical protein RclHR1_09760001 [Rhizophagus clarus]GES73548.1 kinase-like domain-containing protein [Rhizophagus clarus]